MTPKASEIIKVLHPDLHRFVSLSTTSQGLFVYYDAECQDHPTQLSKVKQRLQDVFGIEVLDDITFEPKVTDVIVPQPEYVTDLAEKEMLMREIKISRHVKKSRKCNIL